MASNNPYDAYIPDAVGGGRGGQGGPTAKQSNSMYNAQKQAQDAADQKRREDNIDLMDNIAAGVRGFANAATFGQATKLGAAIRAPFQPGNFADNYIENVLSEDEANKNASNRYPLAYIGGNIVGGAAAGGPLASAATSIPRGLAIGAGMGGVIGGGQVALTPEEQRSKMLEGALIDAPLTAIGPVARAIAPKETDWLATALEQLARARTGEATKKLRQVYEIPGQRTAVQDLKDMAIEDAQAIRSGAPAPGATQALSEHFKKPSLLPSAGAVVKDVLNATPAMLTGNAHPLAAAVARPTMAVARSAAARMLAPVAPYVTPGAGAAGIDALGEPDQLGGPLADVRAYARARLRQGRGSGD